MKCLLVLIIVMTLIIYTFQLSNYIPQMTRAVTMVKEERVAVSYELFDNVTQQRNMNSANISTKTSDYNFTQHIGFLKVHKAGSSTMSNILFRFGVRHSLTFAIPSSANYLHERSGAVHRQTRDHFDILAVHTRYSPALYNAVLAKDAVNIAIVREPLDRMISAAYYYGTKLHVDYLLKIPRTNFIHNLIRNPERFDNAGMFSETKNSMGFDFGFTGNFTRNNTVEINQRLDVLNREFELVLVMERFEESLVLMKRLFNWQLQDIIFKTTNRNPHKADTFTQEELENFRRTCFLDYAVYNYFTDVFQTKVQQAGDDFQSEVAYFKDVIQKVSAYCSNSVPGKRLVFTKSVWNEEFNITIKDCQQMKTTVLNYIDILRRRHYANKY